jgi:hypothetical protein
MILLADSRRSCFFDSLERTELKKKKIRNWVNNSGPCPFFFFPRFEIFIRPLGTFFCYTKKITSDKSCNMLIMSLESYAFSAITLVVIMGQKPYYHFKSPILLSSYQKLILWTVVVKDWSRLDREMWVKLIY